MAAWLARNSLDLQSIFEAIADTKSSENSVKTMAYFQYFGLVVVLGLIL
jgi:hypothetical protein